MTEEVIVFLPDKGGYYRFIPSRLIHMVCDGEKWIDCGDADMWRYLWQSGKEVVDD